MLLATESVALLVVALTVAWALLHQSGAPSLIHFALRQGGAPSLTKRAIERLDLMESVERRRQLRRLVRAQVYYMIAGPLGIKLLLDYRSVDVASLPVHHPFTPLHQIGFALAMSHWIISLLEDASNPNGFKVPLLSARGTKSMNLWGLYLLHHLVAIAAFGFCLATQSLPALGSCGLAFELPLIFVNVRDIVREFAAELRVFEELGGHDLVRRLWLAIALAVLPGRVGVAGLYVAGLARWGDPDGVGALPTAARAAYVGFGGFFSALSLAWLGYLRVVHAADDLAAFLAAQGADDTKAEEDDEADEAWRALGGGEGEASDSESASGGAAAAEEGGARGAVEYGSGTVDPNHSPTLLRVSPELYRSAANMPEKALLLLIHGIVYNLTDFAARHPGGAAVLRRHCGTMSASEAFDAVGHSDRAKLMMASYAVGVLASTDVAESEEDRRRRWEEWDAKDNVRVRMGPYVFGANHNWYKALPGVYLWACYVPVACGVHVGLLLYPLHKLPLMSEHAPSPPLSSSAEAASPSQSVVWLAAQLRAPAWCALLWLAALVAALVGSQYPFDIKVHYFRRPLDKWSIPRQDADERRRWTPLHTLASPLCHAHAVCGLVWLLIVGYVAERAEGGTILAASHLLTCLPLSILGERLFTARGVSSALLTGLGVHTLSRTPAAQTSQLVDVILALATSSITPAAGTGGNVVLGSGVAALTVLQSYLVARKGTPIPPHAALHTVWLAAAYLTAALVSVGTTPLTAPFVPAPHSVRHLAIDVACTFWTGSMAFVITCLFGLLDPRDTRVLPWSPRIELRVLVYAACGLGAAIVRGEFGAGWLALPALLLLLLHGSALYGGARHALRDGVPPAELVHKGWLGATLTFVDEMRMLVLGHAWFFVFLPLKQLLCFGLPRPFTFYASPMPIADMGEGIETGVAHFVYPAGVRDPYSERKRQRFVRGVQRARGKEAASPTLRHRPKTYVCNVGHILDATGVGATDWMHVGFDTWTMSQSLVTKEAAKAGFCGQYLAYFPSQNDGLRQLNLTAWADDHAAHEWYVNNEDHHRVVDLHRSGGLATFSSLLARLHEAKEKKAVYHVRCLGCRRLITGYPAQRFCTTCGKEAWEVPLF